MKCGLLHTTILQSFLCLSNDSVAPRAVAAAGGHQHAVGHDAAERQQAGQQEGEGGAFRCVERGSSKRAAPAGATDFL